MPTTDVCQFLEVTPSAVSRMVARGSLIPAVKAPGNRGAFMFRRRDIEAFKSKRDRRRARTATTSGSRGNP
ncbi:MULTISPECIES: helix-turn-helix domain-containing protein [unclassified Rhodococcus (in: high G+C Gram-positive bacteria)]|uniref:helix-turn-helix domain-containing protein n=1 Tax=unclassified Rhodococcus (in: high G+C Gram-positive bacteria) TaxID=192944 RepID=UPI003592F66E